MSSSRNEKPGIETTGIRHRNGEKLIARIVWRLHGGWLSTKRHQLLINLVTMKNVTKHQTPSRHRFSINQNKRHIIISRIARIAS